MSFPSSLAVAAIALVPFAAIADPAQPAAPAAAGQSAPAQGSGAQPPAEPAQTAIQSSVDAPKPQPVQATASQNGAGQDAIVCKNMPPKVGSRLGGGRECHTQREWDRVEKESQDLTRRQEQTGYTGPGH